jgi:DNA-binding FadR family transcriptional regulator
VLSFAPVGSIADVQRCFEFRASFEGRAAALAAERHDRPALERIEAAYAALDAVVATGELGVDADLALHRVIVEAARNHFFTSTLAMLEDQIRTGMTVTRSLSLRRRAPRLRAVQDEHRRVVDAIAARDGEAAGRAMLEHIERARRRMLDGDDAP